MTAFLVILDAALTLAAGAALAGLVRTHLTFAERSLIGITSGLLVGTAATYGLALLTGLTTLTVLSGPALVLVVGLLVSQPRPTISTVAGVQDRADPKATGCYLDGVTVDSAEVFDPPEHLVGTLQLRSSPHCGTSWGRFVPTSALATKPALTIEIDVYRPGDGMSAKYHVTYDGLDAYGNMLISAHECVYAQVTLIRQGQPSLPAVQTGCQKSPS